MPKVTEINRIITLKGFLDVFTEMFIKKKKSPDHFNKFYLLLHKETFFFFFLSYTCQVKSALLLLSLYKILSCFLFMCLFVVLSLFYYTMNIIRCEVGICAIEINRYL